MMLLKVLGAVGYVVFGTLCMGTIVYLYNIAWGFNKSEGYIGMLMIVGYGILMFGMQSTILTYISMWVIENWIHPKGRTSAIYYSVLLMGISGIMAPLIPLGLVFPFSIMGLVAGIFGGILYGFLLPIRPMANQSVKVSA